MRISYIGPLPVSRTQSYDLVERANYFKSLFKIIPAKQCDILASFFYYYLNLHSMAFAIIKMAKIFLHENELRLVLKFYFRWFKIF